MKEYADPELIKLNEDICKLVDDTFTRKLTLSTEAKQITAIGLAKAYKTLQAILLLCKAGYGQDAGILLRSLFNLTVNVLYINKDPVNRAKRYIGYGNILRQKIAKTPTLSDIMGKLDECTLNEIDREVERAKETYKYNRSGWSDKSIKDMAKEVGLESGYDTAYVLMSSIEHSDARSADHYVSIGPTGVTLDPSPSTRYIRENLLTAAPLMLIMVDQWKDVFNLGIEAKIKELLDTWSAITQKK